MTWLLDSQAGKTIVRPDSRECAGKFSRSSSGRFQPYVRNCSRGGNRDVIEPPSYFKDVCVLPNPSWERVPRGKMKVFCINKNMYVDAWEVKKDWDEVTLRGEIRKLFSSVLKDERGEEIG